MKKLKIFLILFFILNFFSISLAEKNDQLKIKISKNLRCVVCQGQSIYDSQSDFAVSIKLLINNKIDDGLSETEIYEFLKDKYGEWIIYDTSFNKKTFILWGLPVLLFFLGGVIILKKIVFRRT
tara:strand:+ start:753 stop:1124 length:372 start_codon:yes stop_codon:yes gene_type:complete